MNTGTAGLEAIFRRQMAAYGNRDLDALMATFAEDCVLRDMADPRKRYEGREAVRGFLEEYFADLANVDVTILTVACNEDTVVGEIDVRADWVSAPFHPDRPRRVRFQYAVIDTIANGLVTYERFYWDSEMLRAQLKV